MIGKPDGHKAKDKFGTVPVPSVLVQNGQNYKDSQEDEGVLFHAENRVMVDPRPGYLP